MDRIVILVVMLMTTACNSKADFAGSKRKTYEANAVHKSTFLASDILEGSQEILEGGRYVNSQIIMDEQDPISDMRFQITRDSNSMIQKQGHDSSHTTEEFDVGRSGMLDLVVVLDDSGSMRQERIALGQRLDPLLSSIKDTHWQIAVVTMSDPCVNAANLIKPTDVNYATKFENAVKVSRDRDAIEQGFPKAIQALQGQCGDQRNWVRPGSAVAVLIVSDEDNCGSDAGERARCNSIYGKDADEMVGYLQSVRDPASARVYSIVSQSKASCPKAGGIGTEYMRAANLTGGVVGSICASDYTPALSSISSNVSSIVKREFVLKTVPDMQQFTVLADGIPVTAASAWTVVGNRVTLNSSTFKNVQKITLTYSHGVEPKFSRMTLSDPADVSTLMVEYDGVIQPETTYSYVASTSEVIFSPLPPDDAVVRISWRPDDPLPKLFPLEVEGIRADTLVVNIGGQDLEETQWAYDGHAISFVDSPADGSVIIARYRTDASRIDTYDIGLKTDPSSLTIKDEQTGANVPYVLEGKKVKFAPSDIIEDRRLVATIDYGEKPADRELQLPNEALDGSLTLNVDGQTNLCKIDFADNYTQEQQEQEFGETSSSGELRITQPNRRALRIVCPAGQDYASLLIKYKYETTRRYEFKVPDSTPLSNDQIASGWKVFVNGIETTQYTRNERTIIVDSQLIQAAKIKVEIEVTSFRKVDEI